MHLRALDATYCDFMVACSQRSSKLLSESVGKWCLFGLIAMTPFCGRYCDLQRVPAVICLEPAECRHRRPALAEMYLHKLGQLLYQTISSNEFLVRRLQPMVCCVEVELIVLDERSCNGGQL
jgi:hypothetical protein